MKTSIKIEYNDWVDGEMGNPNYCPIALALRREIGKKYKILVDTLSIKVQDKKTKKISESVNSKKVKNFIASFDADFMDSFKELEAELVFKAIKK